MKVLVAYGNGNDENHKITCNGRKEFRSIIILKSSELLHFLIFEIRRKRKKTHNFGHDQTTFVV